MLLRRSFWVFMAAFIGFMLFNHLLPITDPVESNYVETAKEMVLSADWVSPRIYGEVWFDKPVLFYWLVALAFKLFGFSELVARLVPALFGALGVALIYWFVAQISSPARGLLAAVFLGTSFQYFLMAKLLITDMVLFVFDSAALVFFFLGYIGAKGTKGWYLAMYPCFALAVLTKGPVGVVLPGFIIVVFLAIRGKWPEFAKMRIFSGTALFLLIALPWYWQMYSKHGWAFLKAFFGVHNYLRATVSEHPKDNVFYYYAVVFLLGTMPWTGLAAGGLLQGFRNLRRHDFHAFFTVWAAVYFVFYSFMATKYPTYTFPMLFPTVILAVDFTRQAGQRNPQNVFFLTGIPLTLLGLALAGAASKYLDNYTLAVLTGAVVLLLVLTWRLMSCKDVRRTLIAAGCCAAACYVLVSAAVLPAVAESRSGKALADRLEPYYDYKIGVYQYYSTSAVFYSNRVLIRIEPPESAEKFGQDTLSWSAKYTMPVKTLADFVAEFPGERLLIAVPSAKKQQFEAEAADYSFAKTSESAGMAFYELTRL